MEHGKCDLCDSEDYVTIWDKSEREKAGKLKSVVIREPYTLGPDTFDPDIVRGGEIIQGRNVMCRRCGLVYVTPRMGREELDHFYAEDYRKIYKPSNNLDDEKRHAETAWGLLSDLHGNHLDIGCSTGQLIKMTGGFGVEPNREHCEIARASGLNVKNCTLEDYNTDSKFDIITMLNSLEHVISPTEVLNKISSLLNTDGHVLISVPSLYNQTVHTGVDVFLSNAHLYTFSRETLVAYFYKCGIQPVKLTVVIEEVGDKLYLLGKKAKKRRVSLKIHEQAIPFTRNRLADWEKAYKMKLEIHKMGFR